MLISTGRVRERRGALNEQVLDADRPVHRLVDSIGAVVDQEAATILDRVKADGDRLDWATFTAGFTRIVRRVILGDTAADDRRTTDLLNRLRAAANWSFLRPPRPGPRRELASRLDGYVDRAEPGSLAALLKQEANRSAASGDADVREMDPAGQVCPTPTCSPPTSGSTAKHRTTGRSFRSAAARERAPVATLCSW